MSDRKLGNKKRKPSFGKWKTRYSMGLGLKHRRMAARKKMLMERKASRRAKEMAPPTVPVKRPKVGQVREKVREIQ